MDFVQVAYNLHNLDKISNSIYFLSDNKYYCNNTFDWQNRKYNCTLITGKKPICGIISKDFEAVKDWENRKKKNIIEKMTVKYKN